ncbi:thioester reductase domain-containing protein, partial [Frankia sp. CpI1-P]
VHCLVRGADAASARERLRANLTWYRLWDEIVPDRLSVVVGDLAAPRLGLSEEDFNRLARTADVVYHAGASVNWLLPYASLKAANVTGTQEVLRLAARHRTVPVHHISTTGVFTPATHGQPMAPDDPTGPPEDLSTGYRQSKYVAERVIGLARERGLPVSVYRADVVCGDQRHGACQTRDFVWLSLKGILQAGMVPDEADTLFPMIPVDYASAAVVTLSQQDSAAGRTFHLYNPAPISFRSMVDRLGAAGYALTETPWEEFAATVRADRGNALFPVLDTFAAHMAGGARLYLDIDVDTTERALAHAGITCPPIDDDLFARYTAFFADTGYFPPRPS